MTEPLLTKQDLESPTWKKIEAYFTNKLDNYRKQNDSMFDMEMTSFTRGRIDTCKELLYLNPENDDI